MSDNLTEALSEGIRIAETEPEQDFCFGYENELYRYASGKVKLLFHCLPVLKCPVNKGDAASPNYHYVFSVSSPHFDKPIELDFSAEQVSSKASFTTVMCKRIPNGFYKGNQKDWECFFDQEMAKINPDDYIQ